MKFCQMPMADKLTMKMRHVTCFVLIETNHGVSYESHSTKLFPCDCELDKSRIENKKKKNTRNEMKHLNSLVVNCRPYFIWYFLLKSHYRRRSDAEMKCCMQNANHFTLKMFVEKWIKGKILFCGIHHCVDESKKKREAITKCSVKKRTRKMKWSSSAAFITSNESKQTVAMSTKTNGIMKRRTSFL